MLRKIFNCVLSLPLMASFAGPANAQEAARAIPSHKFSYGIGVGLTDSWTDIGTKRNLDHYTNNYYWHHLQLMGQLHLSYSFTPAISARLSAGYGHLYASDQFNKSKANENVGKDFDVYQRYTRNLDFKTDLYEGSLMAVVKPLRLFPGQQGQCRLQPVLMAGLAYFHFDPKASYTDPLTGGTEWVKIHDLHLEGEGLDYPGAPAGYTLSQWAIPMGAALHWELSETMTLGLEYLYRKTFTDYLDGVSNKYGDPAMFRQYLSPEDAQIASQIYNKTTTIDPEVARQPGDLRGSPKHPDAYSSVSVTLFLTIKPYRTWWPVRY